MGETKPVPSEVATKERPILFSGPMVRAILDGRKTQTRRVVKTPSWAKEGTLELDSMAAGEPGMISRSTGCLADVRCPYGVPGDRLWVRETHRRWTGCGKPPVDFVGDRCFTDYRDLDYLERGCCVVTVPSIHMPRWASRITLEIVGVRVERVQEISLEDVNAEGISVSETPFIDLVNARVHYANLWDSLNAKRDFAWGKNPWVWVIEFRRMPCPTT